MAKNLAPSSRALRMITEGPLSGFLHTQYPDGIFTGGGGEVGGGGGIGGGGEPPLTTYYTTFMGTIYEAPAPFYRPTPSADTRQIYVSPTGNNANDGTQAAPVRTLTHAISLQRTGYPDHILLDCNGRWREQLLTFSGGLKSGRSASEPAVLGWYNPQLDGRRPIIEGTNIGDNYTIGLLENCVILGVEFYGYRADPFNAEFGVSYPNAKYAAIAFRGRSHNVLLQDCKFNYTEIIVSTSQSGAKAGNFTLSRNIFSRAYTSNSSTAADPRPSNIYANRVGIDGDFVMEDNVFDYGGWHPSVNGAGANSRNHNAYLSEHNGNRMFVRRNIFSRGSSHGCHQRSGGIQDDNLSMRCSVGLQIGYNSNPLQDGWIAYSRRNVVLEGASQYRGGGNIPAGSPGTIMSGAIWGLVTGDTPADNGPADYRLEENLVAKLAQGSAFRNAGINPGQNYRVISTTSGVVKVGNITEYWSTGAASPPSPTGSYPDPGRTLGTYYALINDNPALAANGYDSFMTMATNRGLCQAGSEVEALAINAYLRAGFGMS